MLRLGRILGSGDIEYAIHDYLRGFGRRHGMPCPYNTRITETCGTILELFRYETVSFHLIKLIR